MAKYVGDTGGIARWREAHDKMTEQLEAAEGADADDSGKVAVDFAACRDGYGALAGMFGSGQREGNGADDEENRDAPFQRARDGARGSDSRRGSMAQDKRRRAPYVDVEALFPPTRPHRDGVDLRGGSSSLDEIFAS